VRGAFHEPALPAVFVSARGAWAELGAAIVSAIPSAPNQVNNCLFIIFSFYAHMCPDDSYTPERQGQYQVHEAPALIRDRRGRRLDG
jgi:hypothetical protein